MATKKKTKATKKTSRTFYTKAVLTRMTETQLKKLRTLSKHEGKPASQVIRDLIINA